MVTVVAAVVAVIVLFVVTAPVLRVVLDAEFRRLFPRPTRLLVLAVVGWAVLAVGVAIVWPWVAVVAAVGCGAGALVAWWLARPGAGSDRGRPPGSRSMTRSIQGLAHRDHYLGEANRHGPVFTSMQPSGPVVCVVGLERGQRLVRDHRAAIGPSPLAFTQQIMGGFLRYMDDDTHDIYGPLFRRAMSRPVTESARPLAEEAVRRELTAIGTAPIDPSPALDRIAYEAVLHALFGLTLDSELGREFQVHYPTFARSAIMHPRHRRTVAALDGLRSVAHRQLAVLDQMTADGVPPRPCALTELREHDPSTPDDTCVDNLLFMLKIGSGNVSSLLRWLTQMLGREPAWSERLRAADSPDLADAFVMEALRLAQSEYVYRKLVDDVDFDGFHLRRGWLVRICVWESHRDPEVFEQPEELTDRFLGHRYPQTEYCPFGFDRHACNSVGLASMIARTFVNGLAAHPEVVVRPAASLGRDLRHWSHWRPGPDLAWSRSASAPGRQVALEQSLQG